MQKLVLTALLSCTAVSLSAQFDAPATYNSESERIEESLDNFKRDYTYPNPTSSVYDTILLNTHRFAPYEIPRYSDTQLAQKLREIPSEIDLDFNPYVKRYIEMYAYDRRESIGKILGLQKVYFPIFEAAFDKAGVPMELKYLSIVESALNPHAVSRVGATGLWQFMYNTGLEYGLDVSTFIDERKDPFKSSEAAARYLKDAYDEFGDWQLAIAAYNCGKGNVRKAIIRSGGKQDFWSIRQYLPEETRGYVPAFIAAVFVFHTAADYNIYPVYVDFSLHNQDTVQLSFMDITLQEIADLTGCPVNLLINLNPELKQRRIPYSDEPYSLRVPSYVAQHFAYNKQYIADRYGVRRSRKEARPIYEEIATHGTYNGRDVSRQIRTERSTPVSHTQDDDDVPAAKGKLQYYTVQQGDIVGNIAARYDVSVSEISRWNGLNGYRIHVGQRLRIYSNTTPSNNNNSAVLAVANKPAARSVYAKPTQNDIMVEALQPAKGSFAAGKEYYTIRNGDSLWTISRKYPGTSVEELLAMNPGLGRALQVGQQIRVR